MLATKKCAFNSCGIEFEATHPRQRYCCTRCKEHARWQRSEQIEKSKQRSQKWYSNPENKLNHMIARRGRRMSAKTGRGEWEMPAPMIEYLPGGCVPIAIECGYKFEHWQLASLHGMLSTITGPHSANNPVFTLFPWHLGCGWAAYIRDIELARSIAMRTHVVDFNDREQELALGWLVRVKAPLIKPGVWKLRITTITPVCCRATGGTYYMAPTANNIKGTLEVNVARRLGIKTEKHDVQVRLLDSNAFLDKLRLSGNGSKLGDICGWSGSIDIEVNALGRLLLECAALGMGLGGKSAFGFGRIKVETI